MTGLFVTSPPRPLLKGLLLAFFIAAGAGCERAGQSLSGLVELTTLEGEALSIGATRQQPLLVVFIAINNPLAMSELARMEELVESFSEKGLESVAIPLSSDRPELVASVLHHEGRLITVAMDPEGEAASAFGGVTATPSVFLLAPGGNIVFHSEGATNLAELRATISAL